MYIGICYQVVWDVLVPNDMDWRGAGRCGGAF